MSDPNYCDHCGDLSPYPGTNIRDDGHTTHYNETMRHSHDTDGSNDHYTLLQRDESETHGSKGDDIHIDIRDSKVVGDSVLLDMEVH